METMEDHVARRRAPLSLVQELPDLVLKMGLSQSGVALAEIQDAAHWDKSLGALIQPASESLQHRFDQVFTGVARRAGVQDPARLGPDLLLMIAGIRGLIIGLRVRSDQKMVQAALGQQRLNWVHAIETPP
jgi:hypothetical protein